jgi:hypothetical protein
MMGAPDLSTDSTGEARSESPCSVQGQGEVTSPFKNFRKEAFSASRKKGEIAEFAMIDFILWLVYVSYASQFREHMVTGKGQRAFIFAPNRTMCQGSFI